MVRKTWQGVPPAVTVTDRADDVLTDIDPQRLAILAGAGISIDAPANLPAARSFLECFYEECLPPSFDKRLFLPPRNPSVAHQPTNAELRFELVLGIVQQFDTELEILDVYLGGRPNQTHRCLRELSRRGALLITTNFDTLIEAAGDEGEEYQLRVASQDFESTSAAYAGRYLPEIWHLHGIIRDPKTGDPRRETIVASVRDCWRSQADFALHPGKGHALQRLLAERDLLVIGYSGSDDFDVAPALEGARSERRLIWLIHVPSGTPQLRDDGIAPLILDALPDGTIWYRAPQLNSLGAMIDSGARDSDRVVLLCADTGATLQRLARIPPAPATAVADEPSTAHLTQHFRRWRLRHAPTDASRFLLANLLCRAAGRREEAKGVLVDYFGCARPLRDASDARTIGASITLTHMAVEAGLADGAVLGAPEDLPEEQPYLRAGLLTTRARVLSAEGRFDDAIESFRESLRVRYAASCTQDVEIVEYELAETLFARDYATRKLAAAEEQGKRTLRISLAVNHPEAVARANLLLGRINERLAWPLTGRFSARRRKARNYYRQACNAAFHTGQDAVIAETSGELGLCLYINGSCRADWREAASRLAEAFRIHSRQQHWRPLKLVSTNLALCYELLGQRDRSLLADCVAFKCAVALGDTPTVQKALQRLKAGAEVRTPTGTGALTDDDYVEIVHKALIDRGVLI